jgi:hypothetical protein
MLHDKICFQGAVPAPDSDDESQWLVKSCQAYDEQCVYEPNASDMAALSMISHFEFGLKQVRIWFYLLSKCSMCQLMNQNKVVIVLEGVCWE